MIEDGPYWNCKENQLVGVINPRLPAAYKSIDRLALPKETVTLVDEGQQAQLRSVEGSSEEGYVASKVREGRVVPESPRVDWVTPGDIRVGRSLRLRGCDHSQVILDLNFHVENRGSGFACPNLHWDLELPSSVPFVASGQGLEKWQKGKLGRSRIRECHSFAFSLDSESLVAADNRIVQIKFPRDHLPYAAELKAVGSSDRHRFRASFALALQSEASATFTVRLAYRVLLRQRVADTVFLVARPTEQNRFWQGAISAAMTWVDELEAYRIPHCAGSGIHRFAPFLWFDRNKPLPDQVLRFLHDMPSLKRIIVYGEVMHHDLENLLTALLDKAKDERLCLHVFTDDDFYRDRVNVLRGSIQARMIIADEPHERVRRLDEILSVSVVEQADELPLVTRRLMEKLHDQTPLAGDCRSCADVFLVPKEKGSAYPYMAAAAIPMARYLGAPVLLWSKHTHRQTLEFFRSHGVRRLFLVGRFNQADESMLQSELDSNGDKNSKGQIVRIPFDEPVQVAAVLARFFHAQKLLDWLVRELTARPLGPPDEPHEQIVRITGDFCRNIADRHWAKRVSKFLKSLLKRAFNVDARDVWQDIYIGRDEFIGTFYDHFLGSTDLADEPALAARMAPIWNDAAVLCDFSAEGFDRLDMFPASCFAAYKEAPLLLFHKFSVEEEKHLESCVKELEHQILNVEERADASRSLNKVRVRDLRQAQYLTRLVFPLDIQAALRSLRPLNIVLFSGDVNVPYEAISTTPELSFLHHALGHLSHFDAYETSLGTACNVMFGEYLQRRPKWEAFLCLSQSPDGNAQLHALKSEGEAIREALHEGCFEVTNWSEEPDFSKQRVVDKLASGVDIFHFAGHGIEIVDQPQRSGILLTNVKEKRHEPLNALEIKYHTKIGRHPLVFLNGCFGSSNARVPLGGTEDSKKRKTSMSKGTSERVMGVSSSFTHVGATAVIAPRWEIGDVVAAEFAKAWYELIAQGCSIGEATLLAKSQCLGQMQAAERSDHHVRLDFSVVSYVVWGDPSIRLFPLERLTQHPETLRRLLGVKRESTCLESAEGGVTD